MFWTRPKGWKVITNSDEFWSRVTKPPTLSRENVFLVKCDIRYKPTINSFWPCYIIGQAKETSDLSLYGDKYRFGGGIGANTIKIRHPTPHNSIGKYHLENLIIDGVQVDWDVANDAVRFVDIALKDLDKTSLLVENVGGLNNGQILIDGLTIIVGSGNAASPLVVKAGQFDIQKVKVIRFGVTTGFDSIVISDYASGLIQDIDVQSDTHTNSYILRLNANLAVEGQLVCRNLRAESSKYALYLFGKGIKRAMGEDIVVGAGLNAQGVKINDATVYNLRLWTNPAGAGAIDVSQGGMLRNSFIYSDITNGAVEADIDTEISHCRINVPTAGRRGVHVVNVGTTRGFFNYNKGYGAGNHCDIDLAVADYTTKFNSNCNIVNPKADSAYNS